MLSPVFWLTVATPPFSISAGVLGLLALVLFQKHRDLGGNVSPPKFVAAILLSIAGYTLIVLIMGNFFGHVPMSTLVRDGVGNDRLGWVFIGLSADIVARYYRLFD